MDGYDDSVVRFYRIKSVDIDKIAFDVFAVEDCKMLNDFEQNNVIKLDKPVGVIRMKADASVVKLAIQAVGCIVYNFDMKVANKKAVLSNMDFADEVQFDAKGGN